MESLIELVGKPVDAKAVQAVVVADNLRASSDPTEYGDSAETRRHYLSSPSGGYELMFSGGIIQTIFLYLQATGEFQPFTGPFISGLTGGSDRTAVREQLGEPTSGEEAKVYPVFGRQGPWDRWDNEQFCLHIRVVAG